MEQDNNQQNRPKWTGFFKVVQPIEQTVFQTDSQSIDGSLYNNYSWYQFVTYGSAARLTRYREYDVMDQDVDIARALDIIAEEMRGNIDKKKMPLDIEIYNDSNTPTDTNVAAILNMALRKWCVLHKFHTRMFPTCRKTLKYGDCLYRKRDGGKRWEPVSPKELYGAIVDQEDVTRVLGYYIRKNSKNAHGTETMGGYSNVSAGQVNDDGEVVPASEVVRFTVNQELQDTAPFGDSILMSVYATFKKKQMLEDSIVIYRITRAPEKRVFKIDTRGMSPARAAQYLETVKNDLNQKKIPSTNGGSLNVESVYNPACLSLDTKVPLLDGRVLSIAELIDEHENNIQNWAYSVNPITGELAPGKITWAGVTRKNTQTITITFDNGKELVCTPDHKIPTQNRGFVQAKDLTLEDSLFPFVTKLQPLRNRKSKKYLSVYDSSDKQFKMVHRMVAEYMKQAKLHLTATHNDYFENKDHNVVHHIDFDKFNNNPDNLTWMHGKDHILYHSNNTPKELLKWYKRRYLANLTEEQKQIISQKLSNAGKAHAQAHPEEMKSRVDHMLQFTEFFTNETLSISEDVFQYVMQVLTNDINISYRSCIELLNQDEDFMCIWRDSNESGVENHDPKHNNNINCQKLSDHGFDKIFTSRGVGNFKECVKRIIQKKLANCELLDCLLDYILTMVKKYGVSANQLAQNMNEHEQHTLLHMYNMEFGLNRSILSVSCLIEMVQRKGYLNFRDFVSKCYYYNHKIVSIVYNDELQDVGTLTIDGKHELHDYHTFAIDAGIFVKNSQLEDFFFSVDSNGNGSSVDILPGGQNLGNLEDLDYFEEKLFRGLRVPMSYMKNSADNPQVFNDGKPGLAYIEELRFAQYVERLQANIEDVLDHEFKIFLRDELGFNIEPNSYRVRLPSPSNFGIYREQELNAELLSSFGSADGVRCLSKRFAMTKYLKLSEMEIAQNERWRMQELGIKTTDPLAFRKIYDEDFEEDEDTSGGSLSDMEMNFGGGGSGGEDSEPDLGEEDMGEDLANANDEGDLNAGGGDKMGTSSSDKVSL